MNEYLSARLNSFYFSYCGKHDTALFLSHDLLLLYFLLGLTTRIHTIFFLLLIWSLREIYYSFKFILFHNWKRIMFIGTISLKTTTSEKQKQFLALVFIFQRKYYMHIYTYTTENWVKIDEKKREITRDPKQINNLWINRNRFSTVLCCFWYSRYFFVFFFRFNDYMRFT